MKTDNELIADNVRDKILQRTGLRAEDLACPREKSDMTPCIARDGSLALTKNKCVGCGITLNQLQEDEMRKVTR